MGKKGKPGDTYESVVGGGQKRDEMFLVAPMKGMVEVENKTPVFFWLKDRLKESL